MSMKQQHLRKKSQSKAAPTGNVSSLQSKGDSRNPISYGNIPYLQRTIGNKAVQQLLNASRSTDASVPALQKKKAKDGGLPRVLQSGVEQLSGLSLDDIKVHYNSSEPDRLGAHAFAKGSDIHVAAGQEQHLPHEAWHIVQQKQGRVKPTLQLKSAVVNDDAGLEKEADEMGRLRASQRRSRIAFEPATGSTHAEHRQRGRRPIDCEAKQSSGSRV
jgi:hypothetical protein